jgi:membrane-bound serine protease (ClpP class)
VESLDSLNALLGISDKDYITIDESWSELLVRFLTNPTVAPLLMSLGMLGLFFEIKSPGFGVPGALGLLFLSLFFGSHLLVGLADSSELLLLFAGLFLIILEVFVIPGFGIIGISGFLIILFSLFKMMIGEYPLPEDINLATRNLGVAFMSMLILGYFIFKSFTQSEYYKRLIPTAGQSSDAGYTISKGYAELINKTGVSTTVLRPSGKIEIEGKSYQAMSDGQFIDKGESVTVKGTDENQLIVKKV